MKIPNKYIVSRNVIPHIKVKIRDCVIFIIQVRRFRGRALKEIDSKKDAITFLLPLYVCYTE